MIILEQIGEKRFLVPDDRLVYWIAERIPGCDPEAMKALCRCLGVVSNGEIIAAMALGLWDRGNVEIIFAADTPKWATRDTIRRMMAWPFEQLKCHRVTTRIHAKNERAIRFNEGIGFKREGLIREGWGPGEDAVLLGLLRSEAPEWMVPQPTLAVTREIA